MCKYVITGLGKYVKLLQADMVTTQLMITIFSKYSSFQRARDMRLMCAKLFQSQHQHMKKY